MRQYFFGDKFVGSCAVEMKVMDFNSIPEYNKR